MSEKTFRPAPRRSCWGDTGGDSNPRPLHLPPPPVSPSPSPEKAGGKSRGFQGGRRRGIRFLLRREREARPGWAVGGGCRWFQLTAAASVVCGGGGDCGSTVPWDRAVRRRGCAGLNRARSRLDLGRLGFSHGAAEGTSGRRRAGRKRVVPSSWCVHGRDA
jgi:hypothetical protein